MSASDARFLKRLFDAALTAIEPAIYLPALLPQPPADGRLIVVGAGKAAAAMAVVAAQHYGPETTGVVVTRDGYGLRPGETCGRIAVLTATHPMPTELSLRGADAVLAAVSGLTKHDLVICLISGGGSALLERPAPGVSLAALREITLALLASGAGIGDINVVRKHLSQIKGGRLALAAWPACLETFAISDVPGDDPALIASGPTVADPSTDADALAIARRHGVDLPTGAVTALESGWWETPKPGDPRLARSRFHLIGTARQALNGAAMAATAEGYRVIDLGDRIEGEARIVAERHASLVLAVGPDERPTVILSGGELTVTHSGSGSGGPQPRVCPRACLGAEGTTGRFGSGGGHRWYRRRARRGRRHHRA